MFNRFDTETRIAVMQAIDAARELGHHQVGTDHLLLGLLANARGEAARVLTRAGLDFPSAEAAVIAYHQAHPRTDETPEPVSQDDQYDSELAADRDALSEIGIDLDAVRDAVRRHFGADIADSWGGVRRGDDFGPRGRGRRGPRSERFGPMRRFSPGLRDLLERLTHEARLDFAQSRLDEAQIRLDEQRERSERGERDAWEDRGPRGRGRGGRGHHTHHRFGPGGPRQGFRPDPQERGPGSRLTADRVLLALLDSDDPALAAVLGDLDRAAMVDTLRVDV